MGQFQFLTGLHVKALKRVLHVPVYNTISFTKININILSENTYTLHGTTLLPPEMKS